MRLSYDQYLSTLTLPLECDVERQLERGATEGEIAQWLAWEGLTWNHDLFQTIRERLESRFDINLTVDKLY